jgi:hypothetical protein
VIQAAVTFKYSSALTSANPLYNRYGSSSSPGSFYYEAVEVKVSSSDNVTFISNSTIDTYGYFYNRTFNSSNPLLSLLQSNDDSGGNLQFLLNLVLQPNSVYILVVTTYSAHVIAPFSVTASGTVSTIQYNGTGITSSASNNRTTTTSTTIMSSTASGQ